MRTSPSMICVVLLLAGLFAARPAPAVIKLELTLAKMYQTSKAVLVGSVERIDPGTRVVDVKLTEVAKGQGPGDRLRVQIATPADLLQQIQPGQPVALFLGGARSAAVATVHVADTWLLANEIPGSEQRAWRVVQPHDMARPSFPGRTADLARLIRELKEGRNPILDRVEQRFFRGSVSRLAKLEVGRPAWLLTADFNGDKQPDLLVGTAQGPRLFFAVAGGFDDVTKRCTAWNGGGAYHAVADVDGDGRPDVLLDDALWLQRGDKFTPAPARLPLPAGTPLAAALADVNGDKRPDAVLLTTSGQGQILEHPGDVAQAWKPRPLAVAWRDSQTPAAVFVGDWDDSGQPQLLAVGPQSIVRYGLAPPTTAATLERLTGIELRNYKRYRGGLANLRGVPIDLNGDGRRDLFAVCDTGQFALVNRGFGTFLFDDDTGAPFAPPDAARLPFQLTPAAQWAAVPGAGGVDDLIVLTEDGTVFRLAGK